MVDINRIHIDPPIINASCAWASEFAQLEELYNSPYTGAVTTRTATLGGFAEDSTHAVCDLAHLEVCSYPPGHHYLGSLWKRVSIDAELVWFLTSPTAQLPGVDAHRPLSWHQY
jgi:hypothetical protein